MSHKTSMVWELTSLANKDGSRGKMIKQNHENYYCPWKYSKSSHIACQPPHNIGNMEILYCLETNTATIIEESDDNSTTSDSTEPKIAHIENVIDIDESNVEDLFEENDTESIGSMIHIRIQ